MPMDNVAKRRGKAKIKISGKREAAMQRIMDSYSEDFDLKMSHNTGHPEIRPYDHDTTF